MPRAPKNTRCSLVNFTNEIKQGKVLRVRNGDYLVSVFPDISMLDLVTLDINEKNIYEIIPEYNSGIYVNRAYLFSYVADPVNKKESHVLVPAIDYNVEKKKFLLDRLRYYAEQRSYYYSRGLKYGKLIETTDLNNLIDSIICDIVRDYKIQFIERSATTSHFISNLEKYKDGGFLNWYDDMRNRSLIRNNFYSYPQLRKLVIEYLFVVNNKKYNSRKFAESKEKFAIQYPEDTTPILYYDFINHLELFRETVGEDTTKETVTIETIPELQYEQKQLSDYFDGIPRIEKEKKLKKEHK